MLFEQEPGHRTILFLQVLLLIAVANSLFIFSIGWSNELYDFHPFRQYQNALTIRGLVNGGPWFAYETPVLGPPWSIPFELPVFQWLSAIVVLLTQLSIEHASRLTNIIFFYASLYLCYLSMRVWQLGLAHRLCFLILMLFSPLYLFWSRTAMIESVALFLSVAYLYFGSRYLKQPNSMLLIVVAAGFGVLAGMTKITTFFAICLLLGLLTVRTFAIPLSLAKVRANWRPLLAVFLGGCVLPLLAVKGWVYFGDQMKMQSPLATWLTSEQLASWNFGTLAQRLSSDLWQSTIPLIVSRGIGSAYLLPLAVLVGVLLKVRLLPLLVAIGLFVAATLTFTNLYMVHNYYAYGTVVFLIFALSHVIGSALLASRRVLAATAVAALLLTSVWSVFKYHVTYLPLQSVEFRPGPIIFAARDLIPETEVALIYGADWNSEIAYQIERKAIMDRDRRALDDPLMAASLAKLKDTKIGGVINCVRGKRIVRHATFDESLRVLAMSPQPVLTHTTRWPPSGLLCELFVPVDRMPGT